MAAALLVGLLDNEDKDQHNRNVMSERLPRLRNDFLNFPDHILISFYRLQRLEFGGRITLLLYYYLFLFSVSIPAMY